MEIFPLLADDAVGKGSFCSEEVEEDGINEVALCLQT